MIGWDAVEPLSISWESTVIVPVPVSKDTVYTTTGASYTFLKQRIE